MKNIVKAQQLENQFDMLDYLQFRFTSCTLCASNIEIFTSVREA